MRDLIELLESKSKPSDVEMSKLSYGIGSLNPVMSSNTVKYHYEKLAKGYADRFNNNDGDKTFNYAGFWLHNIFFSQFRSPRNNNIPNGPIFNLIKSKFKTWEKFKEDFKEEALTVQGSGWVYLAKDGKLRKIPNHQVRNDILILVDMWEHAYNLDYGSDKKRYLDNIWRIFDWNKVNSRWGQDYK